MPIEGSFIEAALERKIFERQKIMFDTFAYPQLTFGGGKKIFDFLTTETFIDNWIGSRILDRYQTILFNFKANMLTIYQRCINIEIEESLFVSAEKIFFS